MHTHDTDSEQVSLRPKSSRLDPAVPSEVLKAAAAGRPDVLNGPAMLGLQRAIGNAGVGAMLEQDRSPIHDVVGSGGGSPLPADVRTDMQTRLGHDFSDVRVHTDSAADASAKSVNAHAYTVGNNVVFQRDQYDPASDHGRTTLAHELVHVVQQRSGPVDGTDAPGGIKVSDPSDRFEREAAATATAVMSGPAPSATHADGGSAGGPGVQRHADESAGDEVVQGSFAPGSAVQRDEAPAEEQEEDQVAQGSFVQREGEEEQVDEESGG